MKLGDSSARIIKDIGWKSSSSMILLFLGFVMSVILNRRYGAEVYGLLVLVYTVTGVLNTVYELGVKATLNRYLPIYINQGQKKKAEQSVWYGLIIVTSSIFVLSVVTLFLSQFISLGIYKNEELTPLLQLGILFFIGYAFFDFIVAVLQGYQSWFYEGFLSVLYPLLYLIFAVIAVFAFHVFLDGVIIANILALFFTILIGIYFLKIKHGLLNSLACPRDSFGEFWSECVNFGFPVLLSGISFYLMSWFDKILLGKSGNMQNLTFYYIASLFFNALMVLSKVLTNIFMPYLAGISHTSEENLREKFIFLFRWFLITTSALSVILFFTIRPVIVTLYGAKYVPVIIIFQLLLVVFMLRSAIQPLGMYITNVYGQTKKAFTVGLILTFSIVIFDLFFIPKFGSLGAVYSLIVSYVVYWGALLLIFKKMRSMVPYAFFFKMIVSLCGLLLIYIVFLKMGIDNYILLGLLISAGYVGFVCLFKLVHPIDIILFKEAFKRVDLLRKDENLTYSA